MMEATDADVSLVSLGGIYEGKYENRYGVQCGIYAGFVREEQVNIFRPWDSSLALVSLTGAEIEEMADQGRVFTITPEENTIDPEERETVECSFPYVLTLRGGAELDPERQYRVVFSEKDYNEALAEGWGEGLEIVEGENSGKAIMAWLANLPDGHFDRSSLEI
jgi:hypothetical protein